MNVLKNACANMLLCFSYSSCMVGVIFLWVQIFELEILMDLHVLESPETKIIFLAVGLYVYVTFIITTEKNYSRNSKFDVLHFYYV